jgi:hypothetical protein
VATQKRVVKIGEEKSFRTHRKFFGKPKRLFKILETLEKIFQKKSPCQKNHMDGWMVLPPLQNSSQFIREVYFLSHDIS